MKYKLFVLLTVLLTSTSCNKWLELQPENGLIRENFWQTKEQLQSAVIGTYSSLLNNTLTTNLFVWGELRADMVNISPLTDITKAIAETDIRNSQINSNNALTSWATLYSTISFCNNIIDYGPAVIDIDKTLTQQQLNAYLAEAKGIRALMYFYLLRIWGEVPLQLTATSSDTQIKQLPKSSKEEVYNQIKADLDYAETNAVTGYIGVNGLADLASDKGRITKYTIYALKADVALWMDKYDEVIANCDKIISSQRYGLIAGDANWFRELYSDGNSAESIFEFQYSTGAQNGWNNAFAVVGRKFIGSPIVPDVFGGYDPVNPLLADIRGEFGSYRSFDFVIWKHVGAAGSQTGLLGSNAMSRHWFIYRYADILLMKAEALAWTNKGQEALDIVADIRTRAKAVALTLESPSPSDALAVSDYILRERAREFAFEGKRWFDLLRHAKRNNYAHLDVLLEVIAKVAPADKLQAIVNKYKDVRSHYLPIVITELQADKLLVQNPFYQ